jgi:hypothetical protein
MGRRPAGVRRTLGWVLLGAGLAAVLGAAGLAVTARPGPVDAGELPPRDAAHEAPPTTPPGTSPTGVSTASPGAPPAPDPRPAPSVRPLTPTRLTATGIDAPVDPVAVAHDGSLAVPADPHRVGWWIGSAVPGDPTGTVLIAGHVDTAKDGRGALFSLERIAIGTEVQVATGGAPVTYRVVARRAYAKQRLPKDLFTTAGPARLVVITCGGTFSHGAYSSNEVVYAEPV